MVACAGSSGCQQWRRVVIGAGSGSLSRLSLAISRRPGLSCQLPHWLDRGSDKLISVKCGASLVCQSGEWQVLALA